MKTVRGLLSVAAALALAGAANAITITGLGTAAPPTTFDPGTGPQPLIPAIDDTSPTFMFVPSAPLAPGKNVLFSIPLSHREIGDGWACWSGGYTGDVYYTNGAPSVALSFDQADQDAFYFYVEPNFFGLHDMSITGFADGQSVTATISIEGFCGAQGFLLVAPEKLDSISVVMLDGTDFAVGEFGWAKRIGGCPSQVEICYDAGRDEACLMTPPTDPTSRSACLNMAYPAALWKDFDDMTSNRFVGHTFANLPQNIIAAELVVCMKPHADIPDNDSINLCLNSCSPGLFAWARQMDELPAAVGGTGTWVTNPCTCFTLNLAALPTATGSTDILPCINANRALDVLIQDDTAVEWMRLTVIVCPCDQPHPIEKLAGLDDNFGPMPDGSCFLSAALAALPTSPLKCFDDATPNKEFAYTFSNVPPGIIEAELEIRMQAHADNPGDDSMSLDLVPPGGPPQFIWGAAISSLAGAGGTWNPGQTLTAILDLSTLAPTAGGCSNILGTLGDGALDVWVQDDTMIDYIELRVLVCPDPCLVDLDGDGAINGFDLAILLSRWTGPAGYAPCPPFMPQDLNRDCKINGHDLALLLGSWGPCP